MRTPFWRRRREARKRRRWWEHPEDPENADNQLRAVQELRAFDALGPEARAAIRTSRFDASAPIVRRRYGGPAADDELVAARVRSDDAQYSGAFGPAFPAGV